MKFKLRCQSCDVIFQPKTAKIEKQRTYDCLSIKFYHLANFGFKGIKTVKGVPWLQLSRDSWPGVLFLHYFCQITETRKQIYIQKCQRHQTSHKYHFTQCMCRLFYIYCWIRISGPVSSAEEYSFNLNCRQRQFPY